MAQIRVWLVAMLLAICMLGCSGSENRFGNSQAQQQLVSITVTPSAQSLTAAGQTAQFIATGNYSVAPLSADLTAQAQWSSSSPSVATVSSTGVGTAVGTGTATISATFNGVTGSATVTVDTSSTPPGRTLTSITIIPSTQTLMTVGEPGQFLAIGNYSAYPLTQDLTSQVTWISSDTAVAIVNSSGLATAVSTGTATLTADAGGVVGMSTLTVTTNNTPRQLTAITIIPPLGQQKTNVEGETAQYIAIGSFIGNPTTQDMTNQVNWASSDVQVATINAAGLATTVGNGNAPYPGETTITATAISNTGATITGTSDLTVAPLGPNELPSLTNYMFGQGTGDVVNVPPPPNVIQCGPLYPQAGCTGHFTLGTQVILTAAPSAGSVFGGFSANCVPLPDSCTAKETWVSSCSCSITMTDNQTVGAIFDLQH
jgi:Bacterial Ig-like domain (group 2)/Divergent InlB B-repeat domain